MTAVQGHRLAWKSHPATALSSAAGFSAAWDDLNRARLDLPFQSAQQMVIALEVFGTGQERLFLAHREGAICAMLILRPSGRWRWQTFQPSQQPLGAWVSDGSVALPDLIRDLLNSPALRWALAVSVTQADPRVEARGESAPASAFTDYVETGWIDILGDFDSYWAARGKNLRQNLRKQRNRLETDNTAVQFLEWREPDAMAGCLERYGKLESMGWKGQEGTAIHADNAQGRYYGKVFEAAAKAGEAVVYEYRFDGAPVAIDLCLQRNDQLVILKTTYDESIKHCSPAFLLRQEALQTIFAQSTVKRIEFYGKFMEWHSRWTEHKRTLYHFTAFRWNWIARLAERKRARLDAQTRTADLTASAEVGAPAIANQQSD